MFCPRPALLNAYLVVFGLFQRTLLIRYLRNNLENWKPATQTPQYFCRCQKTDCSAICGRCVMLHLAGCIFSVEEKPTTVQLVAKQLQRQKRNYCLWDADSCLSEAFSAEEDSWRELDCSDAGDGGRKAVKPQQQELCQKTLRNQVREFFALQIKKKEK